MRPGHGSSNPRGGHVAAAGGVYNPVAGVQAVYGRDALSQMNSLTVGGQSVVTSAYYTTAGQMWKQPEGGRSGRPAVLQWACQDRLEKALLPGQPAARGRRQWPLPDFAAVPAELRQHKHLTLQLVWEEYRAAHPEGCRESPYVRWRREGLVSLGLKPLAA